MELIGYSMLLQYQRTVEYASSSFGPTMPCVQVAPALFAVLLGQVSLTTVTANHHDYRLLLFLYLGIVGENLLPGLSGSRTTSLCPDISISLWRGNTTE